LKERAQNEEIYNTLYIAVHSNMAALQLRNKFYDEAKEHCKLVLDKDNSNAKVLYRLASAYKETDQLDIAIQHLTKANQILPSQQVKNELSICRQLQQEKKK